MPNSATVPPLPPVSTPIPDRQFRAFGTARADLDADFVSTPRPGLITQLLELCAEGVCTGEVWQWTVSQRGVALWGIVAATEQSPQPPVLLRCPEARCPLPKFEVHLPIDLLWQKQREIASAPVPRCRSSGLLLRRPAGRDEARWFNSLAEPAASRRLAAARDLITEGTEPPDPRWVDEAARILAEADPLAAFSVASKCPTCGTSAEHPLDLPTVALQRLHQHQQRCLREIHRFASHYGWTEETVMALPIWRRAAYLKLIQGERTS